eukprot:8779972-Alexandrium_andersonii.AAC.1
MGWFRRRRGRCFVACRRCCCVAVAVAVAAAVDVDVAAVDMSIVHSRCRWAGGADSSLTRT